MPSQTNAAHAGFGLAVRRLRNGHGLSQEELAHRIGMHRTYLGGIERGERNPSLRNILRLADALGTSAAELFALSEQIVHRASESLP